MEIPLFRIFWDDEDISAIERIIKSGKYWCTGAEIEDFEVAIAEYLGVKHCVVFNSGGSALFAAMNAHGIQKHDEIIVPSFTFIATAFAPMYVDAKPVFADIEEETFGLDPIDVRNRITSKTRAIMPIHYGGMSCKIDDLKELASEHNLLLIEDAAQSFGAQYDGKCVGTFGESAIFSFCHNKIFTTSEGGCVVTDDDEVYEKLKLFRSYGRVVSGDYFADVKSLDYIDVGHNFRMSTILAALGLSQLSRVNTSIEQRRKNAQLLHNQLNAIDDIITPKPPSGKYYAVYQMYTIRVIDGKEKRDALANHLSERGITSRVYFEPIHQYSVFKGLLNEEVLLPTTQKLSDQVLTLPLFSQMTKEEIEYIGKAIHDFF
ncbi:MAG: DegT/DnrJ/EryC1/StrS family aminotransferase [Candidatus Thorarchaeota archaeon]